MGWANGGIENICQSFVNIHEVWAVPAELGIAAWLLDRQLGLTFLAPAAVAFTSMLAIFGITRYVGRAQKIWMRGIQTRVDVTANMLGSMKAVKMLGFTGTITNLVQGLRVKELQLAARSRRLLSFQSLFSTSVSYV